MKKVLLGSALLATLLSAEVSTILPYVGVLNYDKDIGKSVKDSSNLYGIHASMGDLSYLIELDYAKFTTKYKLSDIKDLNQDDIAFAYSKYYENFMFKIGDHYVSTNDPLLKSGNVIIAAIGGYHFYNTDKLSYGLEAYYSTYSDGQNEINERKSISIFQMTPYLSYYQQINQDFKNTIALKVNWQNTPDYIDKTYTSFEISDTLYYQSFFATLKYYNGEMRTGVKDGGFTVFNTLDLLKDGYDIKAGYYITKDAVATVSYGQSRYQEFDVVSGALLPEGKNSVAVFTFSYSF